MSTKIKTKKIDFADLNVKIAIVYGIMVIIVLLSIIAFRLK